MKRLVWILAVVSFAFAGREEISMLNQNILKLEAENQELKNENKALADANKVLEQRLAVIDPEVKACRLTTEEQAQKITDLEKKLKNATAALEMVSSSPTANPAVVQQTPAASVPAASLFPITSTLMTKKSHDASNIAVLLSFLNSSAESVASFEAKLRFSQQGNELLNCNVLVNKAVASGENTTWYGAVPYNSTDVKNVAFFNADPSTITVSVEVLSVTLTNGVVRKYK